MTVRLDINGIGLQVPPGTTVLAAAAKAGVAIPSLCKHDDLPASAACGICVVKLDDGAVVRACATPVADGMRVRTHDPEIVDVRRTTLELILSTHPNECLTCARNGTCELQRLAEQFGIRTEGFPAMVRNLPRDASTRSVVLDPRKCVKCGRCLTVCQDLQDVWALSFLERGLETRIAPAGDISLAESPCIHCGQCSAHCPVGAIYEYDDTWPVWRALRDPEIHCVAQVAPSVRVSLGEAFGYPVGTLVTGQVYHALRRLGFDTVFDTNFGADVTVMEEAAELVHRLTDDPGRLPLITTCCPAWVDFMEKFHSDMIDRFSSCKSPHAILGTLAKTFYAERAGIDPQRMFMVSVMPCTAKKYEITRNDAMFASGMQDVDASITTREFVRMIHQAGIDFADLPSLEEPDSPLGDYSGAGTIFGFSGGVMTAALRTAHHLLTGEDPDEALEFTELDGLAGIKESALDVGGHTVRLAVAHGLGHVEQVIDRVRQALRRGEEPPYHFIEVMACPGGCIGGGGQSWGINDEMRRRRIAGLIKDDRIQLHRSSHQNPDLQRLYAEFLDAPGHDRRQRLLHTGYTARSRYRR